MLTGTVSGAAEMLHMSQPGISKSIASAERSSGLKLFERIKGRLYPTPEAKHLFAEIETVWQGVTRVSGLARELGKPHGDRLYVVATPSAGASLIPTAIADLMGRYPGIQAKVDLVVPKALTAALLERPGTLGVSLFPLAHPNIDVIARYPCGLVCVMPPSHPLCTMGSIRPQDLLGHKFVLYPQDPDNALDSRSLFGDVADQLDISVEVRSGQSACLFTLAGTGISVVDAISVAGGVFPNLVARPFVTSASLQIQLLRNIYSPMSVTEREFCLAIARALAKLLPPNP